MRLARILPARKPLPGGVRHVTISHAAYCATSTGIYAGFTTAKGRPGVRLPTDRGDTALLCGQKFAKQIIWQ
jgi:hypothetical protein